MKNILTIAVVSDMHCKHGGGQDLHGLQTYLTTDLDLKPVSRHPVEALKRMIKDENICADLLLCPGDITDKMDKTGLFTGWKYLKEIRDDLKASSLVATPGNHDVDSRKRHANPHSLDVIKQLQDQGYPTSNSFCNITFWAKNYCILIESNYCILVFNSSYTHTDEASAKSCIITQEIIEQIEGELNNVNDLKNKFKVCLLHHHPVSHSNFDLKFRDSDFVQNGDRLVETLEKFKFQIIIHGHKHEPKLRLNGSIPVFASGSFSSIMNIMDIGAQNTFHIIKLNQNSKKGTINSWNYGPTKGWTQGEGTYFPSRTGFGSEKTVSVLLKECEKWHDDKGQSFVKYEDLLAEFEDLNYLNPQEQKEFSDRLINELKLNIYPSIFNKPEYLIKQHE